MGQSCCKPRNPQSKRLTKVKAEATAAADAARTPAAATAADQSAIFASATTSGMVMSQGATPASSAAQLAPPAPGASDLLHAGRFEELRELHGGRGQNSRKDPREWLQHRRKRLTKPYPSSKKKKKVTLADAETIIPNPQPITMLEATPLDEDSSQQEMQRQERQGEQLLKGSAPEDEPRALRAQEPTDDTSGTVGLQRQQRLYDRQGCFAGTQLAAPTPCRLASLRFPFMHSATASASTTRSSDDHEGSGEDGSAPNDSPTSTLASASTVIARRGRVVEDPATAASGGDGDTGEDGDKGRGSASSHTPSEYHLAPTSPLGPSADADQRIPTPPVTATRASSLAHPGTDEDLFDAVVSYMSSQKPRTQPASSSEQPASGIQKN